MHQKLQDHPNVQCWHSKCTVSMYNMFMQAAYKTERESIIGDEQKNNNNNVQK